MPWAGEACCSTRSSSISAERSLGLRRSRCSPRASTSRGEVHPLPYNVAAYTLLEPNCSATCQLRYAPLRAKETAMNRVLALQSIDSTWGNTGTLGASCESNHCSSSTAECSTQSLNCEDVEGFAVAW